MDFALYEVLEPLSYKGTTAQVGATIVKAKVSGDRLAGAGTLKLVRELTQEEYDAYLAEEKTREAVVEVKSAGGIVDGGAK